MHLHFIGICGTAMGNVALMMRRLGHRVTGSDENIYPPMSDLLAAAGVEVQPGFGSANLVPRPDLVVIGNRMSRGNEEVEATLAERIPYISMAELLRREVLERSRSIVISGTHGKTTTSSLMAWTLETAMLGPGFLIGGVPGNFDAGWRLPEGNDLMVLEGDEYDTAFFDKRSKFLHYLPTFLLINNVEFDHADIFGSLDEIILSFQRLVLTVPGNGLIVANGDDPNVARAAATSFTPIETVGLGSQNTWRAGAIAYNPDSTTFDVLHNGVVEARLELALLGEFNVRNALGVVAIARALGVEWEAIDRAFRSFRNTRRRLELHGVWRGATVYDDFAHHPTAIRETLRALRARHAGERLWAVFEPRSNTTRRNVFQHELATCFDSADFVLLAQVDRLDQLDPAERLDPAALIDEMRSRGRDARFLPDAPGIVAHLAGHLRQGDVVVVMSNGGFGGILGMMTDEVEHAEPR